jgi:hypothetical protein
MGAVDLDPVKAHPLGIGSGAAKGINGGRDVGIGHGLAHLLAGLGEARGASRWQVRIRTFALAAHGPRVPDLRHDLAASGMDL